MVSFTFNPFREPQPFNPRLLICGQSGFGQTDHIAPALLNELEKYPIYTVDLPSMYSDASSKSPEETLINVCFTLEIFSSDS